MQSECHQIPAMRGTDRVGEDAHTAQPYRRDAITIAERPDQVYLRINKSTEINSRQYDRDLEE